MQMAMSPPPAGRSRWTTRLLAKQVGLTSGCVSDVLRRNGLKPHLVRTYKVSRDPNFAAKVKDVVGLYLNPPEQAVVLSVDEKTSDPGARTDAVSAAAALGPRHAPHARLQAPRRRRPVRGAGDRHGQRYPSRDREPYGDRLSRLHEHGGARYPRKQLHVVLDNSSSHGTPEVTAWLAAAPPRALPLHADQRVLAQSGRRLLRHPRQAVAQRHRLLFQDRAARTSPRVYARLESKPHALRLDQARCGHHQVTPPNAQAHLDGGALGHAKRRTPRCRRQATAALRSRGVRPSCAPLRSIRPPTIGEVVSSWRSRGIQSGTSARPGLERSTRPTAQ